MKKLALVTGAGRGIGAAIAQKLAEDGWRVAVADLTREPAAAVAASLPGEGHSAWAVDVADEASVEALFTALEAEHGAITGLVCNAGILLMAANGERPTIFDMTLDDWERTHAVNTRGVFLCIRAYGRRRRDNPVEGGRVTTTSSVAAELGGYRGSSSYISSKSAILGFTKAMARELAPLKITVNCVAPGVIDAPMLAAATPSSAPADTLDTLAKAVPLGRLGLPEDIAGAVGFLLSAEASYITGATLDVNGGYRMA
ncbi:SDR family oxidoreductase [Bosea sp. F3-2]|uniref:SDR family NAD(P)-dependent oxidoreductase n=1 Tax=Bosea sp. F3-2 TaxID=2599640 RepID=UPI0011EC8E76|nr:SDR family NAD(P)-dependent oxidoreductase [Bosea sp. F3-2]QEL25325.1 SDR family oxidoreductase [Bosea sp. F3-2]